MADKSTPTKAGAAGTTPNGKTPTTADAMFFYNIVKNMKSKADIDWAGVAVDNGFKNAEVAKVRFGQVKRKLGIGENSTPTKTPSKATPSKVTKTSTSPRGKKKTKKEEAKEEDDGNVKMEDVKDSKVKGEEAEGEEPDAQLQNEMDKYINHSPEPYF